LTHPSRERGVRLLAETGLLEVALPESSGVIQSRDPWSRTLAVLSALNQPTCAMALAALLREMQIAEPDKNLAEVVFERWKLSTEELEGTTKLLREETTIRTARRQPWPKLQRILIAPRVEELLGYCQAVASSIDGTTEDVGFCWEKLALPASELNPPSLITGEDLKALKIPPGPVYREMLDAVRDEQLNGKMVTREEAVEFVRKWNR